MYLNEGAKISKRHLRANCLSPYICCLSPAEIKKEDKLKIIEYE